MITMGFFARLESNNLYFDRASERSVEFPASVDTAVAEEAFTKRLLAKGVVLGVGSGGGQTLQRFVARGREVFGVEPSTARRLAAIKRGIPTIDGAFENLRSRSLPDVAGVWCGAALRHVPENYFARVIANVAGVLPSQAPLFLAVELGEGTDWLQLDPGDGDAESLVQRYDEGSIERVLRQQGLEVVERWRQGAWLSLVALRK